jgi:hypothetical protein
MFLPLRFGREEVLGAMVKSAGARSSTGGSSVCSDYQKSDGGASPPHPDSRLI